MASTPAGNEAVGDSRARGVHAGALKKKRESVLRFRIGTALTLLLATAAPAARSASSQSVAEPQKPNIIFILVDDQGYYDLGCYGATEVKTPRIDAMARAGTRFTDYYAAAPICSPSRAGLLTGCYPRRVGNETWVHRADSGSGIHPDELTIAELLRDNGYTTACVGKWHLGLQAGAESSAVVRAMDWYPTLATFAGIKVPEGRVIDGRDISPLLKGETRVVPPPEKNTSLNASLPLRRRWNPPGEWAPLIARHEYNDAFFYHGSQGALAAVRWQNWKLHLNPSLALYDLASDPGESRPTRHRDITRKLRGMAILFQDEMRLDARPAGQAPPKHPR